LHIISCSKRKAWDNPSVTDRYLPATKAYQGDEIADWLRQPESTSNRWLILSAKYGFIEPDHPISCYNVTFNDARTGPITNDALRSQVEHQTRWEDRIPLRRFSRVVVHGTRPYLQRTASAFARTGSTVESADRMTTETASQPLESRLPVADRISAVARALALVPKDAYEGLDTNEPEWPLFSRLSRIEHPWGVISTLAFGLCDYQLGAGGAAAYWAAIDGLLGELPIDSAENLTRFVAHLVQQPVSNRLASQKRNRVRRLVESNLPALCAERTLRELGGEAHELWSRLAVVMHQRQDAKTIAFAMKCFDLLHKAATGQYAVIENAPIIVDLRIARASLASGMLQIPDTTVTEALQDATTIAIDNHQLIVDSWRAVQTMSGGLSLFRIDSLLWQVAEPIYQERQHRGRAIEQAAHLLAAAGIDRQTARLVATELTASLTDGDPYVADNRDISDSNGDSDY
jgi:N-glycosylase/DNA lyase